MSKKKYKPGSVVSAAELRKMLSALSADSIDILKDILADPDSDKKLKLDTAKYIISTVLDDPALLNNNNDNLAKLAEILKEPGK